MCMLMSLAVLRQTQACRVDCAMLFATCFVYAVEGKHWHMLVPWYPGQADTYIDDMISTGGLTVLL